MDHLKEAEGRRVDDEDLNLNMNGGRCIWVPGALIVGAGPSGLATAACLKQRGVPSLILERTNCIASLWQLKTYDRLCLHIPKQFCELPIMPFPTDFPTYPTKQQFVAYMEAYSNRFGLYPVFNKTVVSAEFDDRCGIWRVKALGPKPEECAEYVCRWLVVASGENAEEFVPDLIGIDEFGGDIVHTSSYKSGELFRHKKVLVVGCGNSGMEVCLDLCNYGARPSLVVRNLVHVLPQEMVGRSTFGMCMWLLKWLPVELADRIILVMSRFTLGDTAQFGLRRPKIGPLQLKSHTGKTPVLDVGTLAKIRCGTIKVFPEIKRLMYHAVEFVDGRVGTFDAIILATGYKSNVAHWLKDTNMFFEKNGYPREAFPNGWKGKNGLYVVGFTKQGLLGASKNAKMVAEDIDYCWKMETTNVMTFTRMPC